MNTFTKVFLRKKEISVDRISLYLDFYPPIRNPHNNRLSRRESLGIYLYGHPANAREREFNASPEGQTLDMQKYREGKDRLEYEQMMSDPSTAYLVDDAEFDRQIDELGVTEVGTAAGMHIERGMYVECIRQRRLSGISSGNYWRCFSKLPP